MMQRRRDRQAAMVVWMALAISLPALSSRADSLIVGPTDEGTRTIDGASPPTLVHPSQRLTILSDGANHLSMDSIVEFDIASITTIPHGVSVQSARLFLEIAGAQTIAGPGNVSVNGYPDGDGIVGLGDFAKTTTLMGSTGNLPDGTNGTEHILFGFDVTNLIQAVADRGTMRFVGFHLEDPGDDSGASVWGLAAPDPAERPRLEVTFSAGAVPEPPGAVLIGLGLAGVAALARWRDRQATVRS